jgi:uncharacterized membrane protein
MLQERNMKTFLDIATIVCIGLMIGVEFAVSAFIDPILLQLGAEARAHATCLFAQRLGTVMPFWYAMSLILLIAEAIILRQQPGMAFAIAACAIWGAVILQSVLFLVPIANRVARMETAAFTDALRKEHQKWDRLHRWRVLAISAAMVCLLIGIRI